MKKIGFIGLGTMGLPMAGHLLKAGYQLMVYNRTVAKTASLKEQGAEVADSPAKMAGTCDVVITMLTADAAVEEVLFGRDGVNAGAQPGLIVIDSSTISPETSKQAAKHLEERGINMLDAPVTGSEPQAVEGILTFMVGGSKKTYEKCRSLFAVMGKQSFYMGESGAGSYTKLANNTMGAINLVAFSEAVTMAVKAGIDPALFVQVVSGGGARSGMMTNKADKVMDRDFSPHFMTDLIHKDLGLAAEMAGELKLPAPALALVRELFQAARAKGLGEEDMSAVIKCYEDWAGVEVKRQG